MSVNKRNLDKRHNRDGELFRHFVFILKHLLVVLLNKKPKVLSESKTIDMVLKNHLSVARFGDGEISIMLGSGDAGSFQNRCPELQVRLLGAFSSSDKRLLVCLTDRIFRIRGFRFSDMHWEHDWYLANKHGIERTIDYRRCYGNACISRFYMDFKKNKKNLKWSLKFASKLRSIWQNREVLIVEGQNTKFGTGSNFLDNAATISRILCPDKNAFSYIDDIKAAILSNVKPNTLILLALGPTASVLAAELTIDQGLQCIDIGHADIEYIWMIKGAKKKTVVCGKNSAEAKENNGDAIRLEEDVGTYRQQVLMSIIKKGPPA